MQKSLFSKYYSICVMMILVSIALIGSVFLILTSNYFEQEKYDLLSRNVKQAVSITMEDLSVNDYDYVSASRVLNVYTILGDAIDADIFLVDVNGKTLLCTETSGCNHSLYSVDEDVMSQVIRGEYHNVGHLGSIYSTPHYIVGVPLTTPNGSVVGAVFAASSAESLTQFVADTLQMFALSALAALIVVFICVYYITGRMVRPIRQMVAATESFSKGDFSARVPVGDFDELGKLAMAFNNMASSMTTATPSLACMAATAAFSKPLSSGFFDSSAAVGHTVAQVPQPMQRSGATAKSLPSTRMAPVGHASAQRRQEALRLRTTTHRLGCTASDWLSSFSKSPRMLSMDILSH